MTYLFNKIFYHKNLFQSPYLVSFWMFSSLESFFSVNIKITLWSFRFSQMIMLIFRHRNDLFPTTIKAETQPATNIQLDLFVAAASRESPERSSELRWLKKKFFFCFCVSSTTFLTITRFQSVQSLNCDKKKVRKIICFFVSVQEDKWKIWLNLCNQEKFYNHNEKLGLSLQNGLSSSPVLFVDAFSCSSFSGWVITFTQ